MREWLQSWLFPYDERFPRDKFYSLVDIVEELADKGGYWLGYDSESGRYELIKKAVKPKVAVRPARSRR